MPAVAALCKCSVARLAAPTNNAFSRTARSYKYIDDVLQCVRKSRAGEGRGGGGSAPTVPARGVS